MRGAQGRMASTATAAATATSTAPTRAVPAGATDTLEIHRAQFGELPALARLQRRGFAHDRGYGLATCLLLWCARGPELLVARDAVGQLVGMVIVDRKRGRTPHGRILNLCVAPEQRRRGYGGALLAAAERAAPAERYVLMVDQKNEPAIALYQSRGYLIVGQEPNYYGRRRHGLLMQKGVEGTTVGGTGNREQGTVG
jgi:ribosomal-protein-alanine N-acetyltransferase